MMTTSMLTTCRCVLTPSAQVIASSFHTLCLHPFIHIVSCESGGNLNWVDLCAWTSVSFGRVTTPKRNLLQLRVLWPALSRIFGGWYGRRMCTPWSCLHAVMSKAEWVSHTLHTKLSSIMLNKDICINTLPITWSHFLPSSLDDFNCMHQCHVITFHIIQTQQWTLSVKKRDCYRQCCLQRCLHQKVLFFFLSFILSCLL